MEPQRRNFGLVACRPIMSDDPLDVYMNENAVKMKEMKTNVGFSTALEVDVERKDPDDS